MDLNPYEFIAPYEKKEFSHFCKDKDVDLIIFLTNWLNGSEGDPNMFEESEERSYDLLNYWLDRCSPFLESNDNKVCYFLAANRCGVERKIKFAGTSAILKISKKPALIKKLNIGDEDYIFNSIELNL
jgi:protein N-terminal amidase